MKTMSRVALAGVFALGLASAAQAQSPQIPTPANTSPINPVATDGSPLPHDNASNGSGLFSGRSAFVAPVGGVVNAAGTVVGTGVDAAGNVVNAAGNVVDSAGNVVGTSVGVAGSAVHGGLDATGAVVNGGANAVGNAIP